MSFWLHESMFVARFRAVSPRTMAIYIAIICFITGGCTWCYLGLNGSRANFFQSTRRVVPKNIGLREVKVPKIVNATSWYLDFFSQRGFCITGIGQLSPSLHGAKRDEVIDSTCSFDALSRFLDEVERSEPLPDLRIGTIERIDDDTVKVSFVLEKRQGRI